MTLVPVRIGGEPAAVVEIPPDTTIEVSNEVEVSNDAGSPVPAALAAGDPGLVALASALETIQVGSIAAGETHLGEVGGKVQMVAVEFARPADTTAYAARDAVSNSTSAPTILTIAGAARANGRGGYVVGLVLRTDKSDVTARFKVHLFHTTGVAAINDNAVYTLLWSNRTMRIGGVELPAMTTEGAGSTMATAADFALRVPFVCAGGSSDIFALVETLDAFTPSSGQNFRLELTIDQA